MTSLPRDENGIPLTQTYRNVNSARKVVTTGGTAEQLDSDTECKRVDITAETDNTGYVVVGGSGVVAAQGTRKGVPLGAGTTYTFFVNNLNAIYVDAETDGEGVTYNYFT